MPFFIIFIAIPFVEIMIFMAVGDEIGFFNTLALAFFTAITGGLIVQKQGHDTLLAIQRALSGGALPLREFFDGICLVAAGAMLITPGFLTDILGFSLLIPAVRRGLRHVLQTHTHWMNDTDSSPPRANKHSKTGQSGRRQMHGDIIDVEYEEISVKAYKKPDSDDTKKTK